MLNPDALGLVLALAASVDNARAYDLQLLKGAVGELMLVNKAFKASVLGHYFWSRILVLRDRLEPVPGMDNFVENLKITGTFKSYGPISPTMPKLRQLHVRCLPSEHLAPACEMSSSKTFRRSRPVSMRIPSGHLTCTCWAPPCWNS